MDDARQRLAPVVGATGLAALVGLGLAYVAYMRRYILHDIPLTAALSGQLRECSGSAGTVGYYTVQSVRHHGPIPTPGGIPPILFIHDAGLASSSYEVKPLYVHYAHERTVYALDLPGYGFSERGKRPYSPALYRDAINDFVTGVARDTPVDAVALSRGAQFLALAAARRPEQFHSITLISPTGMGDADARRHPARWWLRLLLNPSWSRLVYDTLTTRAGLRQQLGQMQKRPLDRGLLRYAYVTSHQPGAEYAPLHGLAGALAAPDVFSAYLSLSQPVLMLYGQSARARFDRVDELHARPNWRIAEFKRCGDLVHFDDPQGAIAQMDQHLKAG